MNALTIVIIVLILAIGAMLIFRGKGKDSSTPDDPTAPNPPPQEPEV